MEREEVNLMKNENFLDTLATSFFLSFCIYNVMWGCYYSFDKRGRLQKEGMRRKKQICFPRAHGFVITRPLPSRNIMNVRCAKWWWRTQMCELWNTCADWQAKGRQHPRFCTQFAEKQQANTCMSWNRNYDVHDRQSQKSLTLFLLPTQTILLDHLHQISSSFLSPLCSKKVVQRTCCALSKE